MSVNRRGNSRLWLMLILAFFIALAGCNEKRSNPPVFPDTTLTATPHDPANVDFAIFAFTCDLGSCQFQCSLDGSGWRKCTSGQAYQDLAEGSHTFEVRAVKHGKKDPTPATFTWTIDTTPPDTFIDSNPPNPSHKSDATFTFHCTDASLPCTFQCQMDGGGFASCASPQNYSGLVDGSHTFQVQAIDAVGNTDKTPASYTWSMSTHDYWMPGTSFSKVPDPRSYHTTVWTGTEMIIWGGNSSRNTGGRYNPVTDSWIATSIDGAPEGRYYHTAIWTGTEMIVWGGWSDFNYNNYLDTGGRYDPSTDSWVATSTINAPEAREYHTAVWTGTEMIVWGGQVDESHWGYLGSGGRYNPLTDSWIAIPYIHAPVGRSHHTAIWTGTEMIVWGGTKDIICGSSCHYIDDNTGGRYNPSTDSWTATSGTNAPLARDSHTAVWTGTRMILWGGYHQDLNGKSYLNTGSKYDPATNSWTATSLTNAPSARLYHTAVWAGTQMIVWGGRNDLGKYVDTGGRYNPDADSWTSTTTTNAPSSRQDHTAVWTGTEMIVWGGVGGGNTGGRYNPVSDSWVPTCTVPNLPEERSQHIAVWTGAEMIVWGGGPNTGGRYNPSTDTWTSTSVINAPSPRYFSIGVWTGTEMVIWGGYYGGLLYTGGRYNPSTDSWIATSTTNAPPGRAHHTAVWTGTEMIVWGGGNYYGTVCLNSGGRYDPLTDSWVATSLSNAPSIRAFHTAVWTGTQMIVWGGDYNQGAVYYNDGGLYSPATDSWIAVSISNAPSSRDLHTAVWTGSQMIVWGGFHNSTFFNDGGRYNPATDSWIAVSTANAPSARNLHTAVWTGSQMIVWGGSYDWVIQNTGGRYDPLTDSWTPTSIINAPSGRDMHTAVWTGTAMIIWGGEYDNHTEYYNLNTGGIYIP